MRNKISARELYDQLHERLALRWITTGQRGGERTLERGEQMTRRPSLAGYLNVIHPNKVQIVGSAEIAWLDT
ncbi:MAG: HPr kinase/phosphorylase, partial [Arenimonas sp.]